MDPSLLQIIIYNLVWVFRHTLDRKSMCSVYKTVRELSKFAKNTMDYCLMPIRAKRVFITLEIRKDVKTTCHHNQQHTHSYDEEYEVTPDGRRNGFGKKVFEDGRTINYFYVDNQIVVRSQSAFSDSPAYYFNGTKRVVLTANKPILAICSGTLEITFNRSSNALIVIRCHRFVLKEISVTNCKYLLTLQIPQRIIRFEYKRSHIYNITSNKWLMIKFSKLAKYRNDAERFNAIVQRIKEKMRWL